MPRLILALALISQSGPEMVVVHDCVACVSADIYEEFYRHSEPGLRPIVNHPYSFALRRGMSVRVMGRNDRFRPPWFFVRTADRRLGVIRQDDVLTNDLVSTLP